MVAVTWHHAGMTPLPPVTSRELRPGRGWYVAAGVVAVGGIVAGLGLLLLSTASLLGALPDLGPGFSGGESAVVTLKAGDDQTIYADRPGAAAGRCSGTGENGGTVTFTARTFSFSFTRGNRQWHAIQQVRVSEDGRYRITCGTPDSGVTYAVGPDPQVRGFVGKLVGGLGALFGLSCLGVLIGGVMALVTGVRRNSHKGRLQRERAAGYHGHPPVS